MKKYFLIFFATIALIFGFAFTTNQTITRASSTIPYSMRGHWYNYDNKSHMRITARYVKMYTNWRHVKYVSKSGSYYTVHFSNANPIVLWHGGSDTLHLEYGMSILETYHRK